MRLAEIVSRHLDTSLIAQMTGDEFAYDLFSKLETDEIIEVTELLGVEIDNDPQSIIVLCVKAMIKNKILELLEVYKEIGFGK